MPYLGVKPADEFTSKDLNGEQLILDADADTTITADTDDQIDIRIAGADDFQFTANTFTAQSGSTIAAQALTATSVASTGAVSGTTGTFTSTVDINGSELILDADADTSITADTDDQIDFKIAGADDFRITANTLTALSGSTIATNTIAETTSTSGVTIDGLLIKDSTAAFADGAVATPSITNTGDLNTGVYFPAADTVGITAGGTEQFRFGSNPIPGGSKNMLINGSMAVAQRGSQTGIGGSDAYTLDQWKLDDTNGCQARYTVSQGTSGGVSGKDPWLSVNVTTAEAAVAANEKDGWNQFVEGNNTRQIINSSGQIKASAVSFDVKFKKGVGSSLSTPYTMCVGVMAVDVDYMWVEEVSITADDTWEHKSFAIDALAQAASAIDTTQGYRIQFMMLAGSNYTDGSTGWNSGGSGKPATTNQDNLADATGNILGITNVQWEVGSVATDFAHEDIGTSLAKAQRYFWRVVSGTNNAISAVASYSSTTNWYGPLYFPVTMRAAATLSVSDVTHFGIFNNSAQTVTSAISLSGRDDGLAITEWELTTAGRTAGHAGSFHSLHASATMDLSAEL